MIPRVPKRLADAESSAIVCRAALEHDEINILRGILDAVQKRFR